MKKNYFLLLLIALFALVACDYNESSVIVDTTKKQQDAIIDGKVPLNLALSNADFVFKNTEALGHKNRKIKSIDVLSRSNSKIVNTRSSVQNEQDAPLAYIVNYENNAGFAILAADTKLPPVISIGDEGNFNTEGFVDFIQNNGTTRSNDDINPAQEVQYAVVNNSLMIPSINIDDYVVGVDTTIMLKCLPIVPTKWRQDWPYNYYSFDSNGDQTAAGCVPLTGAQTLVSLCYHHNWRPTTQLSDEYSIDWYTINRMLYAGTFKFISGNITDEVLAAASLIRAIGEDINADYDTYSPSVSSDNFNFITTFSKLGITNILFGKKNDNQPITHSHIFSI